MNTYNYETNEIIRYIMNTSALYTDMLKAFNKRHNHLTRVKLGRIIERAKYHVMQDGNKIDMRKIERTKVYEYCNAYCVEYYQGENNG